MAYRDSSLASTIAGTSVVITKPATLTNGDLMLAYINTDIGLAAPPTITPPAGEGWALIAGTNSGTNSGAPDGITTFVYWRFAGASEASTYTFGCSSSTDLIGIIGCWSGRKSSPTFLQSTTPNSTANASPITVTDGTGVTALAQDDIAIFAAVDPINNTSVWSVTAVPASYTERQDGNAGFQTGALVTRDNVSVGDTGSLSVTYTRSSGAGGAGWVISVISIPATIAKATATGLSSITGVQSITW